MNDYVVEDFKVDNAIIRPIVESQAGSLAKAMLECVTNSYAARATEVHVTISSTEVTVTDDGHGITEEAEIQKFFRTFGTPHEETANKIGTSRFRIGRGQAFVYGVTTWRTGPFHLEVDIDNKGLQYKKKVDHSDIYKGCRIHIALYEHKALRSNHFWSEPDYHVEELSKMVAYMPIPVFINGRQVSKNPADESWDVERETFWIKFDHSSPSGVGTVEYYNQGHLVCRSVEGINAKVITKPGHSFDVNMARNDINSTDPIYVEAQKIVKRESTRHAITAPGELGPNLIRFILKSVCAGQIILEKWVIDQLEETGKKPFPDLFDHWCDARKTAGNLKKKRFIKAANWSYLSLTQLMAAKRWTIAEPDDQWRADCVSQSGVLTLSENMDEAFSPSARQRAKVIGPDITYDDKAINVVFSLFGIFQLNRRVSKSELPNRVIKMLERYEDFETLASKVDKDFIDIKKSELTAKEQNELDGIIRINDEIVKAFQYGRFPSHYLSFSAKGLRLRKIRVGVMEGAAAWTDGESTIWIHRNHLPWASEGVVGFDYLTSLLIHEYCHDFESYAGHYHDHEFFLNFHNARQHPSIARVPSDALTRYLRILRGRKVTVLKKQNKLKELEKANKYLR